jgi:hypothetical protein
MSLTPKKVRLVGRITALIVAPLFVTVLGGIMVDWLGTSEPKDKIKTNIVASQNSNKPSNNATKDPAPLELVAPADDEAKATKPVTIVGKWRHPENSSIFEFLPDGKTLVFTDKNTVSGVYRAGTDKTIHIDVPDLQGVVFSLSDNDLRIHWYITTRNIWGTESVKETVVTYSRVHAPRPPTVIDVIAGVLTLLAMVSGWCLIKFYRFVRPA